MLWKHSALVMVRATKVGHALVSSEEAGTWILQELRGVEFSSRSWG